SIIIQLLSLSSIWALLSAANIYYFLYLDEGYFAADSAEQPLLHLWSLGVEEQFYLIWPFYVFILCRTLIRPSTRMWVTMGVVVSSLVLAQMLITPYHSFAYYMLPTRSWELAAGGVLVFSGLQNAKPPKWLGELLALVGLVSILFSLVYVTESHDVPGFAAVPVVLGTTLLIYAGLHQQTFINRIVSTKALVLVGLVSYSAYLWHWPIIAFLKYSSLEITTTIGISVILATFFFAILSYQMVERPLRYFKASN
ncbi:MAG TPA: acyltransferase, partial [Gammaproteobacteria bacterium]|nr:acyltransferase [Gammaproteobacteria bacterium]